jgi:hypothetical protein
MNKMLDNNNINKKIDNKIFIKIINQIIRKPKRKIIMCQNYHYFKNYNKKRKIFHNMIKLIDKINLL